MSDPVDKNSPVDMNSRVIEEFRANDGKVGGGFEGAPILLMHTVGARSGRQHVNPVMYQDLGGSIAVFASKGGAPSNPDWYYNVVAHPDLTIEIGAETRKVHARVADSDERNTIWTRQKETFPNFAQYESSTDREIPVVVLEPA